MSSLLAEDLDHVLDRTAHLWEELRDGRLFIAGGTGFFGSWLLESYVWACERRSIRSEATVLCRDYAKFLLRAPHLATHPRLRFVEGDVRRFEFPVGSYTHIVHAAADSTLKLTSENRSAVWDTIVDGTRRVLDFARSSGAAKLLFCSSGAVYGVQPQDVERIGEDHPCRPATSYAEAKAEAERLCMVEKGVQTKIARGFAFVGPHLPLNAHFAIGNFVRDALQGGPISIEGDGTPLRSYLYAADLAVWLWTILFKGAPARPYNVGSERAVSIRVPALMASLCPERPARIRIACKPNPDQPIQKYVPSTVRARSELGLEDNYTLEEAIFRTYRYHRSIAAADSKLDGTLWHTFRSQTRRSAKAGLATSSPSLESITTAA